MSFRIQERLFAGLRCPVCGAPLTRKGGSLICVRPEGGKIHCFDLSASGYCDLSGRNGGAGDPKAAVTDRTAFLDAGYYAPLADKIISLAEKYIPSDSMIVDEGCGEGYYSERLIGTRPEGLLIGADLSKFAVDKASRRRNAAGHDRSFYCVASIFSLPVRDSAAGGVLSMFAPAAEAETLRVLGPGGIYLIGYAGPSHLLGLKQAIYEDAYLNETRNDLPAGMELLSAELVRYEITLKDHGDIEKLFGMTPYRFRTPASALERLNRLDTLTTGVEVGFSVYRKKDEISSAE